MVWPVKLRVSVRIHHLTAQGAEGKSEGGYGRILICPEKNRTCNEVVKTRRTSSSSQLERKPFVGETRCDSRYQSGGVAVPEDERSPLQKSVFRRNLDKRRKKSNVQGVRYN